MIHLSNLSSFSLRKIRPVASSTLLLLIFLLSDAFAQQDNLACNAPTNLLEPTFGATFAITSGHTGTGLSTPLNIIDGNIATASDLTLVSRRFSSGLGACNATTNAAVSVTLMDGVTGNTYNRGNFVGLITNANPTTIFDSFTIGVVDGSGVLQGTSVTPSVRSLGDGTFEVGIITAGAGTFKGILINATLNAPGAVACLAGAGVQTETLGILNAFQIKYCAGPDMPCNVAQNASLPNFNVSVAQTGVGAAGGGDIVSPSTTDYATFSTFLIALGARSFTVTDNVTLYPAGTFAGFVIENADFLSVSVLSNFTIELFNSGAPAGSVSGSGLVVGGGVLSASGKKTIGMVSTLPFNQVRIVDAGAEVGFGETRIYNVVFEKFCEGTVPLACNTPNKVTSPAYPVIVNTANTGIAGTACVGCSIIGQDNLIDTDLTNSAQINLLATVNTTGSVSVKKELLDYPANTFAGFDVENSSFAGLTLFDAITVSTYINGSAVPVETKTGSSGLINVGLLSGSRQTIGFLTTLPFDEVQLTITRLAGLNVGTTLVYGAVIQPFCNDGPLACNTPTNLTNPNYAVYVDMAETGVTAIGCVACTVTNTQNVISATSPDDAATLALGLTIGSTASFAVGNAITNYPVGTYVGFDLSSSSLLTAGVLSGVRIRTYLEGVETTYSSTGSGYSETGLAVSAGLLSGSGRQVIGVVSEDIFDEAKIEFTNLVSANPIGDVQIYNFVVESFCDNNPVVCNENTPLVSPTQPVVIESSRTGLSGLVCAACSVADAPLLINTSTTDYATISIPLGVENTGSISVKNGIVTYPANSFAGFVIEDANNLLQADLLASITISTYNNGQFVDSETASNLLTLDVLFPIIGQLQNLGFRSSGAFDEVRISVGSVASVLNIIRVYNASVVPYVEGCPNPLVTFITIPPTGYIGTEYTTTTPVASINTPTDLNFVIGDGALPAGINIDAETGVISGTPSGPTGLSTFTVVVNDDNVVELGEKIYTINISGSLPVKLTHFNAVKSEGATLLDWQTTEETGSDYFEVQRSKEGKLWAAIAKVSSHSDSDVLRRYQAIDPTPLQGENLYRLKMIDLDGTFAYSKIVSLSYNEDEAAVQLYPNPIRNSDNLQIRVNDWSLIKSVKIINATGTTVSETTGSFTTGLPTDKLKSGLYFLQIVQKDGKITTQKFVKL